MSRSKCTWNNKGFVFSLDSVIAVTIVIAATFLFIGFGKSVPLSSSQSTTIVNDTLFVLEKTGYLIQTLDNNSPTQSAQLIQQQILTYLPSNFDANVSVTSYLINPDACALSQNFSACFPDENKIIGSYGGNTSNEIVFGKKFFLRRQPPGDCNISYMEFSGEEPIIDWVVEKEKKEGTLFSEVFFSEEELILYFAEEELEFDFNVSVDPSNFITCDENVTVTLIIETDDSLRLPIDMIIVMDRSRPADDYLVDKNIMTTFLNNALWANEDYIGLASFDDEGHKDQSISSNRNAVENKINNLKRESGLDNAIAEGIEIANNLLTPGPGTTAREGSSKFGVVLTDNADDSDTYTINQAAQYAADNNITFFTVGVGPDIDETELMYLANTTGGEYYYAENTDSLQGLYDLIASRIMEFAVDSNVYIPITGGSDIIDLNGGSIIDQNIVYVTGSTGSTTRFIITYTVNFPCTNENVCGLDTIMFPPEGTRFNYVDSDGNVHVIDFNASAILDFKVRDLNVEIIAGEVIGNNRISLDVLVQNVGELDSDATTLRFYYEDIQGELLREFTVPGLCSLDDPLCTDFSQTYTSVNIDREGVIYSVINDSNTIRECPIGNIDAVNCYGGPETQVFVVAYTIWRD